MKELIKKLKPDCFDDIIALVALFRPCPLESGMVDDYINVKHGKTSPQYPHAMLEHVLKPTNGVILYQEQVMQIAREMARYSLAVPICCVGRWAKRSRKKWPSNGKFFCKVHWAIKLKRTRPTMSLT